MIKKKNILSVILARGGSKGIPKKNIVNINHHPLISYSITAAKNSKFIDKLVVSSDSEKIIKCSLKYGVDASVKRPKYLASDKATSVDALYHAVIESEKIFKKKFDYVIELPCVSPLRDHTDINLALHKLHNSDLDSVISYVDTGEKHPIRLKRIVKNKVTNFCKEYSEASWGSRRQDFEPSYIRNGAIYSMTRDCILNQKSRWGKKSYPMMMSDIKSVNIDTKHDLLIAKLLIQNGYCKNKPVIKKKITQNFSNHRNKILVTTTTSFLSSFKKDLTKKYDCIFAEGIEKNKLKEILTNVDAWICSPSPTYKIDKNILLKAKKLKVIFTPSTGSTHIDKKYLKKKKIKLFTIQKNKKIKKIKASSEFTFGLILSAFRNLVSGTQVVKSGNWRDQEQYIRGNELYKKTIGIIGFGRIGENVHNYSKAFGMKVIAYDPFKIKKLKKLKIYANLNQLLNNADIVAVCVHLNNQTRLMCNDNFFKQMKKNSIFVNTSRGEIVKESSLIMALKSKKIKFAAADVIQNEQKIDLSKNKLIRYSKENNNLIITPHMAGLTYESEKLAATITFQNLNKFFKNNNKV
jgi:D-3-phosphoglycerate dehydrogenase / 2-oxoglutarate reductase